MTDGTQSVYFTDLLVNDVDESQFAAPTSDPISNGAPTAAKISQGRTKNFTTQEDILLVSAWLNVGMDPIQGVDQSQGTYWARIHEYFHANKEFESTRSESSLLNRWSAIQHDVNIFCGCMSRIEARNQSGSRVDDKVNTLFLWYDYLSQFLVLMFILVSNVQIANACELFKEEDKKHRKFNLMHCWNILKDKPKWMDNRKKVGCAKKPSNKKQKTVANSSPASVEPADLDVYCSDAQPSVRPDGKKAAKQKLRQGRTIEAVDYLMEKKKEADVVRELKKEEMCKKAFALQEEQNKLEREKFEFQKKEAEKAEKVEEERILGLDLSTMN